MKLQSNINPTIINRSLTSILHPKVRITCIRRGFSASNPSMSSSTSNTVKVGVGIFVFKTTGDSFITGRRTGNTGVGQGTWALPGGHLEFGESFEECAEREVLEETGLQIKDVRFLTAMNNVMRDKDKGSHYVTIFMRASIQDESAEPEVLEPEKCEGWEWTTWDQMKRYYDLQVEGEKTGGFEGRKLFSPWGGLFEKMPGWRPE